VNLERSESLNDLSVMPLVVLGPRHYRLVLPERRRLEAPRTWR